MNHDRLSQLLAPTLILSAIASVLFVSLHAATVTTGDLHKVGYAVAKPAGQVYVKAAPATWPTRLTALALAPRG